MKNTIVIYHSADFDGLFSREIAKKFFGDRADYIGWDYGQPVPTIPPNVKLYMIDISIEGLMDYPGLVWIDHHKSAIEKFDPNIAGMRIDGVAACRIAWQYFFRLGIEIELSTAPTGKQSFVDRTVSEPLAVRLVGEYDIWDKRDPRAELFQHGLRSCDLADKWSLLLTENKSMSAAQVAEAEIIGFPEALEERYQVTPPIILELLQNGRVLQYVKAEENKGIITSYGFDTNWEGLNFLACNHARFNSHLFTAGIKPYHDALLGYVYDGPKKKIRVSLYGVPDKPHIDLAVIAVKYGGGGHKQACGFTCDTIPFIQ